jgi:hypothetical protein
MTASSRAKRSGVEGFRGESFTLASRDPSTSLEMTSV